MSSSALAGLVAAPAPQSTDVDAGGVASGDEQARARTAFGEAVLAQLRAGVTVVAPEEAVVPEAPEGDGSSLVTTDTTAPDVGVGGEDEKPELVSLDVQAGLAAAMAAMRELSSAVAGAPRQDVATAVVGTVSRAPDGPGEGSAPVVPPMPALATGAGTDGVAAAVKADVAVVAPDAEAKVMTEQSATLAAAQARVVHLDIDEPVAAADGMAPTIAAEADVRSQAVAPATRVVPPAAPAVVAAAAAATTAATPRLASVADIAAPQEGSTPAVDGDDVAVSPAVDGDDAARAWLGGSTFRAPVTEVQLETAAPHERPTLPDLPAGPGEGRPLPPRPSSVLLEVTPEGHGDPVVVRVRVFGDAVSARITRADPQVAQALLDGHAELRDTLQHHGFRDVRVSGAPEVLAAATRDASGFAGGDSREGDRQPRQQHDGSRGGRREQAPTAQDELFLSDFHEALRT